MSYAIATTKNSGMITDEWNNIVIELQNELPNRIMMFEITYQRLNFDFRPLALTFAPKHY